MKRSQILLSVLGAILIVALFYVLLFQPAREEVATIEASIVTEQTAQQELAVEIARLRAVREQAPEVEAQLAAAEAIVPRDAALPSALRQLQLAADEAGIVMQSVTTSRPTLLEGSADGEGSAQGLPTEALAAVDVNVQLIGGYFQVVDFLRRIEDPAISPRGLDWNNATVARSGDEYPNLQVSLSGQLYALISVPPPPVTEELPIEGEEGDVSDGDESAELEVDVEINSEDVS
jgi:Tfp pilus assembly protein PilO